MITEKKLNGKEILEIFGVNDATLSNQDKKLLNEQGYLVLPHLIDPAWLWELRNVFESVFKTEGYLEGRSANAVTTSMADYIKEQFNIKDEDFKEGGLRKVVNIVNEGPVFDRVYSHPKALAASAHLLGEEFKLSALTALEAIPGEGEEGLQADEPVKIVWMLDEFTPEQGTLRIAAGSHTAQPEREDQSFEEVLLTAPAGSVCILRPGVRYAQTVNSSNKNRRFLYCDFMPRNKKQELNQLEYLRVSTYERIIPAARYILEV